MWKKMLITQFYNVVLSADGRRYDSCGFGRFINYMDLYLWNKTNTIFRQ